MFPEDHNYCPRCLTGRMRLRLVTYVNVYNNTLVSVPNMPAWECDFCHIREYNEDALLRIEALVGQAGPPPNRHHVRTRLQAGRKVAGLSHSQQKRGN